MSEKKLTIYIGGSTGRGRTLLAKKIAELLEAEGFKVEEDHTDTYGWKPLTAVKWLTNQTFGTNKTRLKTWGDLGVEDALVLDAGEALDLLLEERTGRGRKEIITMEGESR